jgi:hypothetical protein
VTRARRRSKFDRRFENAISSRDASSSHLYSTLRLVPLRPSAKIDSSREPSPALAGVAARLAGFRTAAGREVPVGTPGGACPAGACPV